MVVVAPPPIEYTGCFIGLYLVPIFMFGFLHLRAWPVLGALVAIGATMVLVQNARWFGAPFTFLADVFFPPAVFFYVAGSTIGFGVCVK